MVFWSKFVDNRWEHNRLSWSQLIDVTIFHSLKQNGNKMIWLRSTGSTVISQLFDSFIVLGIAFDDG
jgi:uncharacterized integral membrane protein (TIGR00697 family)